MIKEPKDIDFHTSGRQLSNEEFALISQWIAIDKKGQLDGLTKTLRRKQKQLAELGGSNID